MSEDRSPKQAPPPSPAQEESDSTVIVSTNTFEQVAQQKESQQAFLIVLTGPHVGKTLKVDSEEITLGRAQEVDFRINDVGISRTHAMVHDYGDVVMIEDLDSANGTYVNGNRLNRPYQLEEGDKITLGSTTILKFTYQDELDEDFQRHMFEAALRDGLTGIYNKKYLMTNLESELTYAIRHNTALSLLLFDIDHFKNVNDTYGHLAGDAALVKLARLIDQAIRSEDLFARYGGEEFAVLCRGIRHSQAAALGERLRRMVASTSFEHNEDLLPVTISIGVAGVPGFKVETPEELIELADGALYRAKEDGRNRVRVARPPRKMMR
jgi:diguanylate cyclase (GGDEF)-like protein